MDADNTTQLTIQRLTSQMADLEEGVADTLRELARSERNLKEEKELITLLKAEIRQMRSEYREIEAALQKLREVK